MIKTNKKIIYILALIGLLIFTIIYSYIKKTNEEKELDEYIFENAVINSTIDNIEDKKKKIKVHIDGEILQPGIIELNEESRIADAIEKAGGVTENADMSKVNLAYVLRDGQKIRIPKKDDETNKEYIEEAGEEVLINDIFKNSQKVNINEATQTELETLNGIGTSTALKIINYRKEHGKFNKIEDIMQVPGIGESKFNNIKNDICVK